PVELGARAFVADDRLARHTPAIRPCARPVKRRAISACSRRDPLVRYAPGMAGGQMEFLQFETFAPRSNEVFSLELGDSTFDMTLVAVQRLPPHVYPGMRRDPFRLVFKTAKLPVLPQRIYPFSNEAMGKLSIFIVPLGRDNQGVIYEAVFN